MADDSDWSCPAHLQPRAADVAFDLAPALDAVVMLKAHIPEDAFTAPILGTERIGSGAVIRDDGLILTIGYLITEAESIWITGNDGTVVAGHPLAYDFASGLGLVLPLGRLGLAPLARGSAAATDAGDEVIVAASGGRRHALKARMLTKRPFAGYWEYVLDEALFTVPAHPAWSGAALVDDAGRLIGIGSLLVQEELDGEAIKGNMFVPVDLLEPIFDAMLTSGRAPGPARPWLGMYTVDHEGGLVVSALADGGPAEKAGVEAGDIVVEVAGDKVTDLAALFRRVWGLGPPGTDVALSLLRGGNTLHVTVRAGDRSEYLRKPRLQ
jgi:S1-C subfamily serine protease